MSMYDKNEPYTVEIKTGESTWICTCGQTKNSPYCDGTHKDLDGAVGPEEIKTESDTTTYVCGCGKTGNGVLCDGTHLN